MSDLSVGDVVRLNSGGPDMTIEAITNGVAVCYWFSWDRRHVQGSFAVSTLRLIKRGKR